MKKIVFLLLMFMGFSCTNVGAQNSYEYERYTLHLTPYRNDYKNIAYHVEKLGENPFSIEWDKGEEDIFFRGVTEINGEHILYGSINPGIGSDRLYDGYLVRLDQEGNLIEESTIDCGNDEHIMNIFSLDELILFQIWSNEEYSRDQVQYFTEIRSYDYSFNMIDSVRYDEYYAHTKVEDGYYMFGTGPNKNCGMIDSNLLIYYAEDNLDIETDTVYKDQVEIPLVNSGVLNGNEVEDILRIDYPGNYSLLYNDFTYKFVVDKEIEGVEDGAIYNEAVTPYVSRGKLSLNGQLFISGTTIENPGNYRLTLSGEGDYSKSIDFTISSNVSGVLDDTSYKGDITIEFEGEGFLNNVHMKSPIVITDEGDYTLKILGENDYYESYYFTLEDESEEMTFLSFMKTYDVVLLLAIIGTGYFILKKKK